MLPAKLYLIDCSQDLTREWKEQFANCSDVEVLAGDYFQKPADAIVSPANSFGIMDGGLDLAIRNELGLKIEQRIQEVIVEKYHGELPVGCAEIIATNDSRWKYLISAPTRGFPNRSDSQSILFSRFAPSWW
jgi:O-acetyl-ADP-ribose deacetylase (regulator of RNase III)